MKMVTAKRLSPNNSLRFKVELPKLSGKEADEDDWHSAYSLQARIPGFAEELVATEGMRVRAEEFKNKGIDPMQANRASGAWISLITCKTTALETV